MELKGGPRMLVATNPGAGRWRTPRAAHLALLALILLAAASAAADPARRRLEGTACQDGFSGSFSGTRDDGDEYVSFQHHFGDGQRLCARILGPVLFDERTGAILELPEGSSVLIETRDLQ